MISDKLISHLEATHFHNHKVMGSSHGLMLPIKKEKEKLTICGI